MTESKMTWRKAVKKIKDMLTADYGFWTFDSEDRQALQLLLDIAERAGDTQKICSLTREDSFVSVIGEPIRAFIISHYILTGGEK